MELEAELFQRMLADQHGNDLSKMQHKYSREDVSEYLTLLKKHYDQDLPLLDFQGKSLVYRRQLVQPGSRAVKLLMTPPGTLTAQKTVFGTRAMEDEIHHSLAIENIQSSRDSIKRILSGFAPRDAEEDRIYAMKQGLELIGDKSFVIHESNLAKLYQTSIASQLNEEDKLMPGASYRHDQVYVVGRQVEHEGLLYDKLPFYMEHLLDWIGQEDGEDGLDDLSKAAAIHFYIGYLHPWFDGNGRMARLLHLWYLVQRGYPAALFAAISPLIHQSRSEYYQAFTLIEKNRSISGVIDLTPFLLYCKKRVYDRMTLPPEQKDETQILQRELDAGKVTRKELDLWNHVMSSYGADGFSTKELERDFQHAAYATIRSFVLKFENMGLLRSRKYGNRVRYYR